jgi:hypothetical protein
MILNNCINLGSKAVREKLGSLGLVKPVLAGSPETLPTREMFHKEFFEIISPLIVHVRLTSTGVGSFCQARQADAPVGTTGWNNPLTTSGI